MVALLAPSLGWGAGFALFEHGNRAMAMGGAFTAVADDPSALFWNPAGIAFQQDKGTQLLLGTTLITPKQDLVGDSPYPGAGYRSSQESQMFTPPHFYVVYPLNDKLTVGGGLMVPFGLGTYWPEDYAGRFISKRVELNVFDISPSLTYKVSDGFALSFGLDYVIGQIDLTKQIGYMNPYTQEVADVGQAHLYTDDFGNDALGWHASFLAKLEGGFSVGALYRSGIDVDFEGVGSFVQFPTGYADFDALLGTQIPFEGPNVPIETSIDLPDFWCLGVAWTNQKWTVSAQYGEMGWSSFQELAITFPENPILSSSVAELYDDSKQYRFGAEYVVNDQWSVQFGYLIDETPQPPASMSPLLADGDRAGPSIGVSWKGEKFWLDVGYLYLPLDKRSTGGENFDGFDATYDGIAHLGGISLGARF